MSSGLLVSVLIGGLGIGGAVGYMAGATTKKAATATSGTSTPAQNTAWFSYDGQTFDTASLPSQVQTAIYQADMEAHNQKNGMVREFAMRVALSKEQGKFTTMDKLPALDTLLTFTPPTDAQAKEFFEQNKDKVQGMTFEQIAPRIKEFMAQQGKMQTFQKEWDRLTKSGKLKMLAQEPGSPTVNIPVEMFPSRGAGKDVLVEISDYLCPHCAEVQPEIKKLEEKLKGKLKFVQINFSLRPTQLSGALTEGAFCASKQSTEGFWKYHDVAFAKTVGTMNDAYDVTKAKTIAEGAGLNVADWEACMKTQEPKDFVKKTADVVNGLGVTGTPTFFLNNQRVNIHSPAELSQLVESKLAG
ncbi:MAG TPA: thioredoxin domain-containing protein [Oligoflexus sp.]|uniref:DsbA family protein n=1 Tax=Oligoflexus sp. TaxID=1971216 RepID=UPI002D2912D0|nr:thioredoxin domain-containing protein [Oligoflexus sp.]HYX38163.1 thioredoxin domain-containing protein [Oligoflexus sp.]